MRTQNDVCLKVVFYSLSPNEFSYSFHWSTFVAKTQLQLRIQMYSRSGELIFRLCRFPESALLSRLIASFVAKQPLSSPTE
jgi:hypothetical protein